jgi:predicted deacylase
MIKNTFLPLFKGVDLSTRKLPLITITAPQPGPTVWITAAIHGDEVTGTAIIHSLLSKLQTYPLLRGTLYSIPIMNPAGFETVSRREPFDEADLNRNFPGDPHGSTAQRHAHVIAKTIINSHPDYVIDLHTDSNNSIAYTIVDEAENQTASTFKSVLGLVQTLGFPWAFDKGYTDYDPKTSLSGFLMAQHIPAVTIELGGPMVVNEYFRKRGLDAIWHFLAALKMVRQKSPAKLITTIPSSALYFDERIHCDHTGIIDYRVKPGHKFTKNQVMGKIRDIYGKEIATLHAPRQGILFSHEDQSIALPGQNLFTYVYERPFNLPATA